MSDNTEVQSNGEDSAVIREMRSTISSLEKQLKNSVEDAEARVERKYAAQNLLGEQYASLAPYFAQEVDGDLTAEEANKWLTAKGLASPDTTTTAVEEEEPTAQELSDVANLGSAVAAVASGTITANKQKEIMEAADKFTNPGDIPALSAELSRILNG